MSSEADLWRVRAPEFAPKWLCCAYVDARGGRYIDVDASALSEVIASWLKLQQQLASFEVDALVYTKAVGDASGPLVEALDMLQLRHDDSPVWWVSLDNGPQFAASLWDLVAGTVLDERYRTIGVCPALLHRTAAPAWTRFHLTPEPDRVYLMSLAQWDSATWPAESEDGPPFTKHISVYR